MLGDHGGVLPAVPGFSLLDEKQVFFAAIQDNHALRKEDRRNGYGWYRHFKGRIHKNGLPTCELEWVASKFCARLGMLTDTALSCLCSALALFTMQGSS